VPAGNERDIILGLKQRLVEAERRFCDLYYDDVFRHVVAAHARNGCEADAEDITQDTFVRALRDVGRFEGRSRLRTWLFAIARHAAKDFYRARATRYPEPRTVDDPEATGRVAAPPTAAGARPAERVLALESRDHFGDLFAQLTEDQRIALTLRIVDKLSVEETATAMGKSVPAVKMLKSRGLRALSKLAKARGSYFADYLRGEEGVGHGGE